MNKKKLILCIGGGKESLIGIKTAKKMGFGVVLVDKSKKTLAKKFCNVFIHESTKQPLKIYKKIYSDLKKKISGVISFGNDVPITVNSLAKKLNLKYYNLRAAKILSNKLLLRKFLKENKINSTKFFVIKNYQNLKRLNKKFSLGVLKPVDSSGARGVYLINKNSKNLKKQFFDSISISASKTCIFEKFIDGDQLSTETLIYKNKAYTVGIADRNYERIQEFFPNIIEDGSDMPSKYEKKFKDKINKLMLKIAKKLKINNCILKGDLVVKNKKLYVIEIAGRLSGGNFSSIMIPFSSGINLVKCAIKLATNEPIKAEDIKEKFCNNISQRFYFTYKKGILKNIKFPKWALKSKKLIFKDFNFKKGTTLEKITNHTNRLGQIIVTNKSRKKTVNLARRIIQETRFNIE